MTIHYPETKIENAVKQVYTASETVTINNIYTCWNDEEITKSTDLFEIV